MQQSAVLSPPRVPDMIARDAALTARMCATCTALFVGIGASVLFIGLVFGVSFEEVPFLHRLDRPRGVYEGVTAFEVPATSSLRLTEREQPVTADPIQPAEPIQPAQPVPSDDGDEFSPGSEPCATCEDGEGMIRNVLGKIRARVRVVPVDPNLEVHVIPG